MITIATHDRIDLIANLLKDLSQINLNSHKVTVIDTNSKSEEFKIRFPKLQEYYPNFNFISLDYDCYDSGAYIYSVKSFKEEKSHIFFQDSIRITNPKLIEEIDSKLEEYDVVPLFNFIFSYWENEKIWAEDDLPDIKTYPKYGIFGPMFSVKTEILNKLNPIWLDKIPTEKRQQTAMERRWAVLFHLIEAKVYYLNYLEDSIITNFTSGNPPECHPYNTWIKKIFINRN